MVDQPSAARPAKTADHLERKYGKIGSVYARSPSTRSLSSAIRTWNSSVQGTRCLRAWSSVSS